MSTTITKLSAEKVIESVRESLNSGVEQGDVRIIEDADVNRAFFTAFPNDESIAKAVSVTVAYDDDVEVIMSTRHREDDEFSELDGDAVFTITNPNHDMALALAVTLYTVAVLFPGFADDAL